MDDRREQDRAFLTFFSRVLDRKTGRLIGYLSDLTTGGALLISDQPLEVNHMLNLQIDLPEDYPQESLFINARVVWSGTDTEPELYKSGIRLMEITPSEISILARLISEHGVSDYRKW